MLSLAAAWVQFMVGELRFHKPHSTANREREREREREYSFVVN